MALAALFEAVIFAKVLVLAVRCGIDKISSRTAPEYH